jgi:hypothetical protein
MHRQKMYSTCRNKLGTVKVLNCNVIFDQPYTMIRSQEKTRRKCDSQDQPWGLPELLLIFCTLLTRLGYDLALEVYNATWIPD